MGPGIYSRRALKIRTLLDLRGNIPSIMLVTDGKYHDSNVLDVLVPVFGAIYLKDKGYIDFEELYNINLVDAFFVLRIKFNMDHTVTCQNYNINPETGPRSDKTILLNGYKSKNLYPQPHRLVECYDRKKEITLYFLTNRHEVSALEITRLYKNRWQIEVFFKRIKQNLTLKKLWEHSKNAVNVHVWTAICTHLILANINHTLRSSLSIYEILQILSISAMDKTPISELFIEEFSNQNFNEQMSLFDD